MSISFSVGLILCLAAQAAPEPGPHRLQAPEMAAQALADLPEPPLSGEPWTLPRALSTSTDRAQQQAITRAYWRLVEAAAKYNFARDLVKELQSLMLQPGDEATFRAARAEVRVGRREAELAATEAQFALAALLRLPTQSALPWPADPPHVGGYRTNYTDLSRRGLLPDRARLIDRILPLESSAIEGRNHAVAAAAELLAAAETDYQSGRADLETVIAAAENRRRQQAAFIEAACRYNLDIAEYACATAPLGLPAAQLAGWMIQSSGSRAAAPGALQDSAVQAVEHLEPVPAPETRRIEGQPTPAIPKAGRLVPIQTEPAAPAAVAHEPTPAHSPRPKTGFQPEKPAADEPAKTEPKPPERDPFIAKPPKNSPFSFKGDDRIPPPDSSGQSSPENRDHPQQKKDSTREKGSSASFREAYKEISEPPAALNWSDGQSAREKRKPPFSPSGAMSPERGRGSAGERDAWDNPRHNSFSKRDGGNFSPDSTALYAALKQADPAVQAKQLTLVLHGNLMLPEHAGRPMTLEACLTGVSGGDRKAAIAAYWTARQRVAEYQVLAEQRDFLDRLMPNTPASALRPSAETEPLQLRAARLEAQADLLEAQVRLIEAQFALARQTQATAAAHWPLPTTTPHFGRYTMSFDEMPRRITESWAMRRLAAAIPQYSKCLQGQAASVVASDAARSDTAADYQTGRGSLAAVLDRTAAQTRRTLDFLQTQADYNRAIADYALTVLPSDTPPGELVEALVVKP
jgi:hypothetical protein